MPPAFPEYRILPSLQKYCLLPLLCSPTFPQPLTLATTDLFSVLTIILKLEMKISHMGGKSGFLLISALPLVWSFFCTIAHNSEVQRRAMVFQAFLSLFWQLLSCLDAEESVGVGTNCVWKNAQDLIERPFSAQNCNPDIKLELLPNEEQPLLK